MRDLEEKMRHGILGYRPPESGAEKATSFLSKETHLLVGRMS